MTNLTAVQVKKMAIEEMDAEALKIAGQFARFPLVSLAARAKRLLESAEISGDEYNGIIAHLRSFESDHSGGWYTAPPTVI